MRVEIISQGRVLRTIAHNHKNYIEAPADGDYEIRLTNNSPRTRMAVVAVDGINVVNNTDAGFDGPGYVLAPWQTTSIRGWRRSGSEVAKFSFVANKGSYAAGTGRGTKNTSSIGVAVFDEKPKPKPIVRPPIIIREEHHHYPRPRPWNWPTYPLIWYDTQPTVTHTIMRNDGHTLRSSSLGLGDMNREFTTMDCDLGDDAGEVRCSTAEHDGSPAGLYSCAAGMPAAEEHDSLSLCGEEIVDTAAAASAGPARDSGGRFTKGSESVGERLGKKKGGKVRRRQSVTRSVAEPVDLGTAYGGRAAMYTEETTFDRASDHPSLVIEFLYGVTAKLIEWGVPVEQMTATGVQADGPTAFPASQGACAPPPGWTGR